MSIEVKRIAREIAEYGFKDGADLLSDFASSLEKRGLIPSRMPTSRNSESRESTPFSQRLRAARLERGWSQRELSRESGIHVQTIKAIERAANPQPHEETIDALSQALRHTLEMPDRVDLGDTDE